MTCEQFSLLIDQYLEGGLDGAQRLMVEEHLAAVLIAVCSIRR